MNAFGQELVGLGTRLLSRRQRNGGVQGPNWRPQAAQTIKHGTGPCLKQGPEFNQATSRHQRRCPASEAMVTACHDPVPQSGQD